MSVPGEGRGPIGWMARNAVAANLLMVFFMAGGAATFNVITKEFFPNIARDTVTVRVPYPGAGPEEVEQGIVLAIEEAVRGMDGVKEIESTAAEGIGTVVAELIEGGNAMKIYQDIKSEVDRVRTFPEDAEEPTVTLDTRRRFELTAVLWGNASETSLRELGERIRDRLLQHEDITQVELAGVRPLEISIEVPRENLRRYGLTLQEVAYRLRNASVELPGGGIKTKSGEILVRIMERRDWGREFARTPIITMPDGTSVLLEDIATIKDGFEESDRYALYNGLPAIGIEVYRVGNQTPQRIQHAVKEVFAEIQPDLPAGTHLKIRFSFADIYRQRAQLLLKNGSLGLCLVLLLLGCFLELRLAFWVMMGIPVSFLGTLLFMPGMDLSLNMMTMFAFIVALGIVVDDAIVVGENIYHYRQAGDDAMTAAIKGVREVSMPIAFSILTNVVAFIPLMLLPGIMGKILFMLPCVVISAFLISWVECLFILPAHLGHRERRRRPAPFEAIHRMQQRFSNAFHRWVRRRYAPFLDGAISHRYLVVVTACSILTLTLTYMGSGRMGFELFPSVESDYAYGSCLLPFGTDVKVTDAAVQRMVAAAKRTADRLEHPELIEGIYAEVGDRGSHNGEVRVYLPPAKTRESLGISTQDFVDAWRKEIGDIPGVTLIRLQADRGGPGSGPALTVELRHSDMDVLETTATRLAEILGEFPLVRDADTGFQEGKRQYDFTITDAGRSAGLTAREVSRQVRNAYEGAEAMRQQRGRNELKVKVRLPRRERESEFVLHDLILRTPRGGEIPLREAVHFSSNRAYTVIRRRNGKRAMGVTADVRPKSKVNQVMQVLNTEVLPGMMDDNPGLSYSYEGRQAEHTKSLASLKMTIPIVLLAIFSLLAVPFRSYAQPLIVMTSIPFGIVGAVAGHLIMGYDLSLIGLIGIVALSGVVVNDSLVMIDFANRMRRHHATAHDAVVAAGVQRFRPIMLTTLTTFGGLMPMIFETSRQARFLIPMALSLGYGLLFATMITLVLVPSLYMILEDIRQALGMDGGAEGVDKCA